MSLFNDSAWVPKTAWTVLPTSTTPAAPRFFRRAVFTLLLSATSTRRRVMQASTLTRVFLPPNAASSCSAMEVGLGLASRRSHVPLRDRKSQHDVVNDEEHHTHGDQVGDVLRGRSGAVQQQVDETRRERESQMDVEQIGDGQ